MHGCGVYYSTIDRMAKTQHVAMIFLNCLSFRIHPTQLNDFDMFQYMWNMKNQN